MFITIERLSLGKPMVDVTPYLSRKAMVTQVVSELDEGLDDLSALLLIVSENEFPNGLPDEDAAYLDAMVRSRIHEFNLACDLAESNPDGIFDGTRTYGHQNRPLERTTIAESLTDAQEQFHDTVVPAVSTLLDDPSAETEWGRFYGHGLGWSHSYTISDLSTALVRDTRKTALDVGRDPEDYTPIDSTEYTSGEVDPVVTSDDVADGADESTPDAKRSAQDAPESLSLNDERAGLGVVETDKESDEWPGYTGEYLLTPEGDREPKATDTQLPHQTTRTICGVEYSMVLDPPCKTSSCPAEGRYILKVEDENGDIHHARLCGGDLPQQAKAIAPGYRFLKDGRMQTEGETFTTLKVANGSPYEWLERHAVSNGSKSDSDGLAYIKYELMRDTVRISVQDNVGEHPREGQYTVDVDGWDGAIPYVEGKTIGNWLRNRAMTHRERLLTNKGVNRHLVSIDHDQYIVRRAQQAYREKNPNFSQPSGMINDHTPVVEGCIPICAECEEMVAGTTLDNTEPCEYCGCEEAEWLGYKTDSETNGSDNGANGPDGAENPV